MSLKNSNCTADFLDFDFTLNRSIKILKNDSSKFKFAFLTILGINVGLRISDIMKLTHSDLSGDIITLKEKKTGKRRIIKINDNIKDSYKIYNKRLGVYAPEDLLFINQNENPYSIRHINRMLKSMYGSKGKNVSTHSLRKTMGRRLWDNSGQSERSLILLSDIFNHTSIATTRRYLGIQQEEINDIYMNL